MKKYFVSLIAAAMIFGVAGVRAQNPQSQYPPSAQQYPYPQAPPPYPQGSNSPAPYPQSPYPPPPNSQGPYPQPPNSQAPYPRSPNSQAGDQTQQADDQPGVARVSFIRGDVSSQRGDNSQWVAATLNTPISAGDRVSTGQASRAELQIDYADILRLADNASANIVTINRQQIQIQVGQGLVSYSVLKGSEATSEIDTPNAAIRPEGEGQYRILVNSNAETQVIVRNGSAEVSTPQGSTRVERGQMITIAGTDDPQYRTASAIGKDEWDSWNSDRDKRVETAQSWRNTDRYYTGSEDLDPYGTWSEVPDYGQVWTPTAADPDWAPYRDGSWVYEPYYGWTWVSYEPWGWAPYHYGRWFVYGGRWSWWPGPVYGYPGYYPAWGPAYVSFFGFGGGGFGFGIGFGLGGFGRFGWLPVGPGDWYHPWYGRWGGSFNTVGFNNVNGLHSGFAPLGGRFGDRYSNVNEALRNDRVRAGISSMNGSEFGRGAVSSHQERISADSFRQAGMMTGRMPVNPSHESFSAANHAASASTIRGGTPGSQHFFSSSRGNSGAALSSSSSRASFNQPSSHVMESNRGDAAISSQSSRQGWQRFSPPQSGNVNRSERGTEQGTVQNGSSGRAQESQGGWQRFNPPSRDVQAPDSEARSSRSYEGAYSNSSSRPALNMRQPIVTPRSQPSYGNSGYGRSPYSGASAPRSYSAPQGGSAAPRGNYSAPRSSNSSGGSRGGGSSHSGGGGGHSNGRR